MKKLMCLCLCFLLVGCATDEVKKKDTNKKEIKEDEFVKVSFSAVGDNLLHDPIFYYNRDSNGNFNLDNVYENTNYLTQASDVSYINLETICGGSDLGLSGYPTFNGPFEALDALYNAGFNWLSGASNHSFDRGEAGIIAELNYATKYDDFLITGIHESIDDATSYSVIEKNGLKIGLLDYTYGLNGFTLPEGKEYLVDLIDEDKMAQDMEELNKISDIQIVSMHWGQEYQMTQNSEQEELAQYLSDLGVDVIVGCHPHVIQPMTYVEGKDGNKTLVMYSLGNFISAQDDNYKMLGGMCTWNIEYNKTTKEVLIEDVVYIPTITYIAENYHVYKTYALKDYTDELAANHTIKLVEGQDVSREYFINLVNEVMGDEFTIQY